MPDRLTFQAALVLVAIALGLAFGAAVLAGAGGSAAKPNAERGPALVQRTPASAMDLLTAARAVPALRAPHKGRVQLQRPTRIARHSVTPALTLASTPASPAESARPTPTAVTRDVAPPPQRAFPAPTPKPEPTPTSTPESPSDLDTTGDFDTTGEPASELTHQIPPTNRTSGGVAK